MIYNSNNFKLKSIFMSEKVLRINIFNILNMRNSFIQFIVKYI